MMARRDLKYVIAQVVVILILLTILSTASAQENSSINQNSYQENYKNVVLNIFTSGNYNLEIASASLLIIFILNYLTGKEKNLNITKTWVLFHKEFFDQQFAHVGVSQMSAQQGGALLDQESIHSYKFYASGRANVHYTAITLDLQRRQDILTMFIFSFIWPEKDRIFVEIPLDIQKAPPIVFSVLRKKELKGILSERSDLKYFARRTACEGLSNLLVVLAEHDETVSYLLNDRVISVLNKFEKNIICIHITDQKIFSNYPFAVRFELLIGQNYKKDLEEMQKLFQMIYYFVDNLCSYKLKEQSRIKSEKERAILEEKRFKQNQEKIQEELQKKKLEKKKEEIANLSREQQKKLEEKEQKQEKKKQLAKRIMKIK